MKKKDITAMDVIGGIRAKPDGTYSVEISIVGFKSVDHANGVLRETREVFMAMFRDLGAHVQQ